MITLGRLVATPRALDALRENGADALTYFRRHQSGDWGDLGDEDKAANDHAASHCGRLLSAYHLADRRKIWIVTEADRSASTCLLPEDY